MSNASTVVRLRSQGELTLMYVCRRCSAYRQEATYTACPRMSRVDHKPSAKRNVGLINLMGRSSQRSHTQGRLEIRSLIFDPASPPADNRCQMEIQVPMSSRPTPIHPGTGRMLPPRLHAYQNIAPSEFLLVHTQPIGCGQVFWNEPRSPAWLAAVGWSATATVETLNTCLPRAAHGA